jgi:hypothetical protein
MFTTHALKRCQQRGISKELCDLVVEHGEFRYDKHGARVWFLTKKAIRELGNDLGTGLGRDLERKNRLFVVESLDSQSVITVGYSYKTSKAIGRTH